MGTAETGSTGGESSQFAQPVCECNQPTRISLECVCPDLSNLTKEFNLLNQTKAQDRLFLSEYLSIFPEIAYLSVLCKQKSSTNTSGLFYFLPASVKGLRLGNCFRHDIDLSYNNVQSLDRSSLEILGISGKTVKVDLSHNNLAVVYITKHYASEDLIYLSLRLDLREVVEATSKLVHICTAGVSARMFVLVPRTAAFFHSSLQPVGRLLPQKPLFYPR
ncbi:TIR domain [Branchiostoma belcheri]|nr:TIR domain [Branchiostoma belcheri]